MYEALDRIENRGIAAGMAKGMAKGMATGMAKGVDEMSALIQKLLFEGRIEEAKKITSDKAYRDKVLREKKILP